MSESFNKWEALSQDPYAAFLSSVLFVGYPNILLILRIWSLWLTPENSFVDVSSSKAIQPKDQISKVSEYFLF